MEAYVLRTLKRMRKEAPRRSKDLRTLCDDITATLEAPNRTVSDDSDQLLVDKFLEPLRLGCESRAPRVMEISLTAYHFLMEYGYLSGNRRIADAKSSEGASQRGRTQMDSIVETIGQCSDESDDVVQLQVVKALLMAVTSVHCEVHEASLLLAVRSCFHIHLITKNAVNKTTAKAALTQMLSVINQRMENFELKAKDESDGDVIVSEEPAATESAGAAVTSSVEPSESDTESQAVPTDTVVDTSGRRESTHMSFPSIMHKDAFLIFRALCKLSMKGLHDDSIAESSDLIAMQNKILSLELIFHILQQSGPAFRSGEKFIYAIRHYLCVSLLSNCTSHVNQVTGLSLQIFVLLMDGFKDHLKSELEVFVTNIFLRILESENSSYDHKLRVLEVFHIICTEPSAMVEIFINYDCDLEAIDLFRRFVDGFAKIAKNPSVAQSGRGAAVDFMTSGGSKRLSAEEQSLRVKGLEGLVIVLRSLLRSANLWGETTKEISNTPASLSIDPDAEQSSGVPSAASMLFPPTPEGSGNAEFFDGNTASLDPANAVEVFDKKKKMQEELETGILKFNLSAKKGLSYLAGLGHIEMSPLSVAQFLTTYQDRLDKAAVGEYLGREREYENGFCIKVLHEYVDLMDFTGMAFDLAIRSFLSGFRLPGEAQKIDRLMEKFAERYYKQNRETFASADMAFILAFSTIMLQTNLHNPAIRDDKRMTKEQFIKQNKGISSDGELSDEMLIEIYDRIASQPIEITQNDKFKAKPKREENFAVFQPSTDKRRKDAFNNERKEMVRASEAMFKQKSARGSVYIRANTSSTSDEAYARPMFDVVWAPILGVLSQILETSDDQITVDLCLISFQYAIRLACRLEVSTARNTFINALAKFTALDSIRELQKKNVDCIKCLLEIALAEGDGLDESWAQVLQTVSQLARLFNFGNGVRSDDVFGDTVGNGNQDSSRRDSRRGYAINISGRAVPERSGSIAMSIGANLDNFTRLFSGPSRAETARQVEESNAELIAKEIDNAMIDRIYTSSQQLSADSVLHFVTCLCQVSMLEISSSSAMNSLRAKSSSSDSTNPRVFSLQKLVEVADYNMGSRPRLAWAKIWALLATHFAAIGVHDNHALAMCAIDSLKQLSIKFLQKEELSNFNFQRVFLKPFETIISRTRYPEIKDLVLRCIDIMIRSCATNIRSGWKSIFAIFEVAAGQDVLEIASIAFDITERLTTQQFQLLIYDFVELMNCLVAFMASQHTGLSLKALGHLARCADRLADGTVSPALEQQSGEQRVETVRIEEIDQDASVFRLWFPLLLGLATRVGDGRLAVRLTALDALHQVLRSYGHFFSPQTWAVIFKGILFPLVDSAKTDATHQPQSSWPAEHPSLTGDRQSWIGTMAESVFKMYTELYVVFNSKAVVARLLPEVVRTIESCICQETESLARIALKAFNDLIMVVGSKGADDGSFQLDVETANLISSRLSHSLLQNLCLDFGSDAGMLDVLEDAPASCIEMIGECPLARRRRIKDGAMEDPTTAHHALAIGVSFDTPYATGKLVEVVQPVPELDIESRNRFELCWGASLYSTDIGPSVVNTYSSQLTSRFSFHDGQPWRSLAASVMTSMVVSLDACEVFRAMLVSRYRVWSLPQLQSLLSTVEACHWHARSFNENFTLRLNLHKQGFMIFKDKSFRLPHLLEQEVQAISILLDTVLAIYLDSKISSLEHNFIMPWMEKICSLALRRYIAIESEIQTISDKYNLEFAQLKQLAYRPSVLYMLRMVHSFTFGQFSEHKSWLVPLLPQLVLCDDKSVRCAISDVFTVHVNPILLQ